jgi:hypothetical protein
MDMGGNPEDTLTQKRERVKRVQLAIDLSLLVSDVPLGTGVALVHTHGRTASLRQHLGLGRSLITVRVGPFRPPVSRRVRPRATAKRRAGTSILVTVSARPIEDEDNQRDDRDKHPDGSHDW